MDLTTAERVGVAACGLLLIGIVAHPRLDTLPVKPSPFRDILPRAHRIPKVIYKTGPLPETSPLVFPLLADISYKNPEITVKYFNDSQSRRYVREQCGSRTGDAYDRVRAGGMRADLFRYCVLWKSGGVYGDLSQRYRVPLHALVDFYRDKLVLVRGHKAIFGWSDHNLAQTSFIAAVAGHPFIRLALDTAVANIETGFYGGSPADVTGPGMFSTALSTEPNYSYKMELKDDGATMSQIQMGQALIVTNVGGAAKSRERLGNATPGSVLWAARALYNPSSTGTAAV